VAYKATEVGVVGEDGAVTLHGIQAGSLVFVECAVGGLTPMERLDHHNPGDRGYGARPELYWEASSLGQLFGFLKAWGAQRPTLGWEAGKLAVVFGEDRLLLAASDHCPTHAFQGRCPGIDVDALRSMRRANAAAFQKKDLESFNAEVDAAVKALMDCPVGMLEGMPYRIAFEQIPQLNHAQLECGVAVQYTMPGTARDPRTKVGLLGGEPALIRAWIESKHDLLDGVYGDPERGYAGGYIHRDASAV